MDLRRLRAGEWIAAVSGVALLASLFLPWYRTPDPCLVAPCPQRDITGWQALAVTDVILALIALAAIGLFVVTATQATSAVPIAYASLLFLASMVTGVLTTVRVLSVPDVADGRAAGIWIGLAAAVGVTSGAVLAMRDERLSGSGGLTDGTGKPVSAPPEVEAIPAPPPRHRSGA